MKIWADKMRGDPTGNPVEQDKNGLVFSNSFNHLNQNVATVPGGTLAVLGRVNYAGGTVTVNSVQAQISPELIFAAIGIPFTPGTNTLNTVFTDPFGRSTNRQTSVVVSQKAYGYDANGNLTNDSRLAYYWNDENRLVAVRDAKTGALIQENRYDGLGRRREKVEFDAGVGVTNRYIYKDWLVLAITDGEGNVLETYTHGADLSGHVGGGAGGIGGILASTQAGGPAYYHYDFNGNIVNVSSSNQTQLARYTYSPFGEVLLKDGSFNSRYQFSTKEFDASTGLNYYGYRYYNPELGRWINRDPIGERGGINLYQAMFNNPQFYIDPLGLRSVSSLHEAIDRFGEKALRASEEDFERQLEEYDALPPAERVGRNRPGHPVEFCGRVCEGCNDGEKYYYHTGPVAGGVRWCQPQFSPPCNEGDRQVGTYHSHPRDGSGLSPGDRSIADRGVLPPEHPNHIPPGLPIGATWEDSRGRVTDIYTPGRGTRRMRDGSYAQF